MSGIGTDRARLAWRLTGLDCADCAAKLERGLSALTGVHVARVSFAASTLVIEYDPAAIGTEAIRDRVARLGYGVAEEGPAPGGGAAGAPGRRSPVRFGGVLFAGALAVAGAVADAGWIPAAGLGLEPGLLSRALYAAAIVSGGWPIGRRAVAAIRLRVLDMNVLMAAAVVGAALIGEWAEGAAVVVLFALGSAIENRTLERARADLAGLLELAPPTAVVRSDGVERTVPVDEVAPGDVFVVLPGARVATDGTVLEGSSAVEEAAVTGEPLPAVKQAGDPVWAGTLNGRGHLVVRATRTARDNTLARIAHLVEEAQAEKAPLEQTVERFAHRYTPAVLAVAALIAVVPPLAGAPLVESIRRALTMLVIACPCALVISTPVSIVSAMAAASRSGAVVKGGRHLEALARIDAVAFDKTGTLTLGRPVVGTVLPLGPMAEDDVLRLAASVERRAHHPVAGALVAAADERGLADARAVSFESLTGQGARAVVDGREVSVGSPAFVSGTGCGIDSVGARIAALEEQGRTVVVVAAEGDCLGLIAVSDPVREGARRALDDLRSVGAKHLALLTGDARRTAEAVAAGLPLDDVLAGLMPEDKVLAVEQLEDRYGAVAMVGDGVNDAPALAAATVGVAMGAIGSDTALETADVALMGDELEVLPFLMRLARLTVARIRENIAASVLVKAVFLVLAVTGNATMWSAVFADMGMSLLVTANGMRLLAARPRSRPRAAPST